MDRAHGQWAAFACVGNAEFGQRRGANLLICLHRPRRREQDRFYADRYQRYLGGGRSLLYRLFALSKRGLPSKRRWHQLGVSADSGGGRNAAEQPMLDQRGLLLLFD